MEDSDSTEGGSSYPRFWEKLTPEDQEEYYRLQTTLTSPACKNRRNRSMQAFSEIVAAIRVYVERGDDSDWIRALVCGIIWLDGCIAINTHQLRLLMGKCKSSINGSFQALGFIAIPTAAENAGELIKQFPFMRNHFSELRQWTVRQKMNSRKSRSTPVTDKSTPLITQLQLEHRKPKEEPKEEVPDEENPIDTSLMDQCELSLENPHFADVMLDVEVFRCSFDTPPLTDIPYHDDFGLNI